MIRTQRPSVLVRGIIVLGIIGLPFFVFRKRFPSDAALVQQFTRNRAAFLELTSMLATNSPADPLRETMQAWSMEHYQRYRALLRQVRVTEVIREGTDVRFQVAGPRAAAKGRRIEVTRLESEPDVVVGSVDDFRKLPGHPDHAYRSLGEGWFLRVAN